MDTLDITNTNMILEEGKPDKYDICPSLIQCNKICLHGRMIVSN